MKTAWQKLGIVAFWLSWPFFYFYLKGTERTRVLITCGNQIILTKSWHGPGKWSLPGGGLHKGEDHAAGAIREVEEEIGIKLEASQLKPLASAQYRAEGLHFQVYYFIVTLSSTVAVSAKLPEVVEAKWMDIGKLDVKRLSVDAETALGAWKATDLIQ